MIFFFSKKKKNQTNKEVLKKINSIRKLEEVKEAHDKLLAEYNEYQQAVAKTIKYNNKIIRETEKLDELETEEVFFPFFNF